MNPKADPQTGKPLPFAQQPREFQIAETVKGVAGFVMCDRSGLTRDEQIDWYMAQEMAQTTAGFGEGERSEIRAGVVRRWARRRCLASISTRRSRTVPQWTCAIGFSRAGTRRASR